ncbi:MAG: Cna B-type domain-containing protein, partial [Oscillospiraceae bacterium]|nr:Cna B-type domain-containing protein [Oscillospiraceae bacterium]
DQPDTETVANATVDADGNLNLTIQTRQTIEIIGLPAGTQATVTEQLTVEQQKIFTATYRTRNQSGEEADADNTVTIPANANATAVITNQYTPQATTVDLDVAGTKNFNAESNAHLPGGSFTFKVQRWDGSAWVDMTTATTAYAAGEQGTKTFLMENVLQGITYTHTGTWSYQVLEVKGSLPNLTYDRTLYTFTVTVTDNGGQLVAVVTDMNNTPITDGSYEVTFQNTYHTAPVSIDVTKEVVNNSGDSTISKAGFGFIAVQTDASWNPLADGATMTVYSDGVGEARFTATYTQAGSYYYLVSEVNANKPGWTYSNAQYRVTITVTESDGNLTSAMTIEAVAGTTATGEQAIVTGNKGSIAFVNTYDPADVTVDLNTAVKKELTGKELTAGAFTFKVYNNGTTTTVLTGTNDANGNVTFDQVLSFQRAGKYAYDIVEMIPEGAAYDAATGKYTLHGMTYDATIYDLVVEVTNNSETGALEAVFYFEDSTTNTVTFRNVYTVTPTTYTFSGTKVLTGRAISAGEFTFWLYEGDTPVEKATNKADGSFTFSDITYTSAGIYTYTIREEAGNKPGVTYIGASNPITVTVIVTDTNGILSAAADVANADIRFENSYTAKAAKVTFDGIKTLVGAMLADNTFTFKLYKTDNTFALEEENLVQAVKNANGRFVFDALSFTETGTFFYAIVEDATVDPLTNVVYDGTVHQFRVQVSDLGDGQLRVEVQNMGAGITTELAASITVSSGFTNATFDEVTEKEVYLEGAVETHIDGQKVNAGDILEYYITYTNYTGKDVVVDIMDTIPAHTSYVEGSASHNGSYVGTHLLWVLHVGKGESVTVSFQVKVEETNSIVANTAVVRDGVNTYNTNQVTNHTYADETQKDVFYANEPTVSIDGNKVALGDTLLYTIRFTNTTSEAVSVTITDRIPAHTSYVAGSATLGGVYADGMLTWNMEVAAWDTVTVTFQVTVMATEQVNIQNQATILVGERTITTNVVSNGHTPETTGFTVNKVWQDANNQDGIRPSSITVNVYGNGKLVTSVVLTDVNDWTYTLTGLDKYEDGAEIVYTVEEVAVNGYINVVTGSMAEGFVITNTHTVEKTEISVSKVWDDKENQDGKRPTSIIVHLLANGEHTAQKVVLNAENGWSYTWTDLDAYHNGTKIVYTVYEEPVEGYTVSYSRDTADHNHVIITNSYTPDKTALTVQKVWQDNDNQDGIRPDSVQVELYANGVATGKKVMLSAHMDHIGYIVTGVEKEGFLRVTNVGGIGMANSYNRQVVFA